MTRAAAPAEQSDGQVSRCSGGRVPCDLVTRLTLAVDGQAVAVPDRAVLLLADVNRGRLRALGAGRFVLELDCGDAAASYIAKLFFDRTRVERLEIWAGEANALAQVTVFHDPDRAFRGM